MKHFLSMSFVAVLGLCATSCATISEDECVAGSWEDIGFGDGEKGRSRAVFADYNKTCLKYDIQPDRSAYFAGYEQGLKRYCVYDRGFEHGRNGKSEKTECRSVNSNEYLVGFDEGRIIYNITQEHEALINIYEDKRAELIVMEEKLLVEGLEAKEVRRIKKKILRLEEEIVDAKVDIRIFERENDLAEYDG